ncbi:unnamed protein product [Phytomonas sp. Hart1]|nr:unnamed protein product [Phytomonas sp. Hart1]|eukprot:CCW69511.1 unnamed protein product [Phytomonas sp. isolate Hart1]
MYREFLFRFCRSRAILTSVRNRFSPSIPASSLVYHVSRAFSQDSGKFPNKNGPNWNAHNDRLPISSIYIAQTTFYAPQKRPFGTPHNHGSLSTVSSPFKMKKTEAAQLTRHKDPPRRLGTSHLPHAVRANFPTEKGPSDPHAAPPTKANLYNLFCDHNFNDTIACFPSFVVPVCALWGLSCKDSNEIPTSVREISTNPLTEAEKTKKDVVKKLLMKNKKYLMYVNPFTNDEILPRLDSEKRKEWLSNHPNHLSVYALWELGYVSLHPKVVSDISTDFTYWNIISSTNKNLEDLRVKEFAWYRLASLFPHVCEEIELTEGWFAKAKELLPPNLSPLQVLCSAPHLFKTYSRDISEGVPYEGYSDSSNHTKIQLYSQFILDNQYAMTVNESEEELRAKLEETSKRKKNRSSDLNTSVPINRRKRRRIRRRLHYLTNRTPFFDERVLIQFVFDHLPEDKSISFNELLDNLPDDVTHCFPGEIIPLFSRYPSYFHVFYDNDAMIQRADLPKNTRLLKDITAGEILQEFFLRYPYREHPEKGTCIYWYLSILPSGIVRRLNTCLNFEEEVLRKFPEKVEILPLEQNGLTEEEKKEIMRLYINKRHFFIPFRFLGDWRKQLEDRYYKFIMKKKRSISSTVTEKDSKLKDKLS